MKIRALTIVVVTTEEKEPPAFSLVGNLTPQEAISILHQYMVEEARQQGREEAKGEVSGGNLPEKKQKPSERSPSDSEGVSEG